jgi:hypothetical protein
MTFFLDLGARGSDLSTEAFRRPFIIEWPGPRTGPHAAGMV